MGSIRKNLLGPLAVIVAATVASAPAVAQQQQKPNIVIIWGDDIGISDISAYSHSLMGFKTSSLHPASCSCADRCQSST
jgi:arylsulfatase